VFPEALGNKDVVLPRGVVCDRCNHGPLALVDRELVNLMPVRLLRAFKGIPNKNGELIGVDIDGRTHIQNTAPGQMSITYTSEKVFTPRPGGFTLNLKSSGPIRASTWSAVARAVYKIALECVYIDHGAPGGFDSRFDELRRVVLGHRASDGCLIISKAHGEPTDSCSLQYLPEIIDGREHLLVHLDIWGMHFGVEALVRRPTLVRQLPPGTANVMTWTESQLA
jgi:hypothetical protein